MQYPCTLKVQTPSNDQGPATFLPLTTFLRHSAPSVPSSPLNNPILLSSALAFRPLSYSPEQNVPPPFSSLLPICCAKPSHLHPLGQAISTFSPLPDISLSSFLSPFLILSHTSVNLEILAIILFYSYTG